MPGHTPSRLGLVVGCFYDIGLDPGYAGAIRDAGGPPRHDGGSRELTAELARPDTSINVILLAHYDRLPRQPHRSQPLLAAAARRRCPILTAPALSTLDRADLDKVIDTAQTDPLSATRVLHGIGDGQ